jgi:hypothetical protein
MGQISDTETLVIHQKVTPGNNPEDFKQQYDHGGSLQLHILEVLNDMINGVATQATGYDAE